MKTILDDLKSHKLTLTEAVNVAQNRLYLVAAGYDWCYTLYWK